MLVEVPRVRVQGRRLPRDGVDHAWVCVPDDRDIVVRVEVAAPIGRLHPRAIAAHEVQRRPIGERFERAAEDAAATGQQLVGGSSAPDRCPGNGRHASRHLVEADRLHLIEEGPRGLRPATDVLVVRMPRHAPGGDEDRLRHPPGQQVPKQRRLAGFQREDRCVPRQECLAHLEQVGSTPHQGLQSGRDIQDERRVRHVAEVDDPGHLPAVVEEQVVERDVVVDDLSAEPRERRHDALVEAGEHARQQLAPRGVLDGWRQERQLRQVPLVPPDPPAGRGVEEATERNADTRNDLSDARDRLRIQLGCGRVASGQQRQETDEVGHAVDVDAGDRRAVEGRARNGHRQGGVELRDALDRGHLHLDHAAVLGRVRDLQDPGAAIGIGQPEVLVSLADDGGGRRLEAEVRACDVSCLVGAQRRRGGVEDVGRHRCGSYRLAPAGSSTAESGQTVGVR